MMNTYKLAKTWQHLLIVPSVLLILLFWSLVFLEDDLSEIPIGAWVFIIIVTAITSSFIYTALTSKTITSPEGIENVSFGIRIKVAWDNVERIDMNQHGFVNLIFKEPIYKNGLINLLLSPLAYDKTFQLSPYIEDLATSNLLKDIATYAPTSNIPEFAAQQKRSAKTYQKAGMIGLYYFGWFIVWGISSIFFQAGAETYLASLGFFDTAMVFNIITGSLVMGLFVHAMSLLQGYNREVAKLSENEVSHKARAYYLSPFVLVAMSLFVGIIVWIFSQSQSNDDFKVPTFIIFLIAPVSLWVSMKIERLLFWNNFE